jgi:hypothetical protein
MAWGFVQVAGTASAITASKTATFGSNITNGNGLIALVFSRTTITGISDSQGQTWTAAVSPTTVAANRNVAIYKCPVTAGGTAPTVTATNSGADWMSLQVVEISGLDSAMATDGAGFTGFASFGAGTTFNDGPTGAPAASGGLGISLDSCINITWTPDATCTTFYSDTAGMATCIVGKTTSAGTGFTSVNTTSFGDERCGAAIIFALASGGGAGFVRPTIVTAPSMAVHQSANW